MATEILTDRRKPAAAARGRNGEERLARLLDEIRGCRACADDLGHEPVPIIRAARSARIVVASQAPGNLAHRSATPFLDPSGDRLRDWLGVGHDTFYDETRIAIVPMGFCFPGYDAKGGDKPPLKACADLWRERVFAELPQVELTLLIGGYAQRWHLGKRAHRTLTETVRHWRDYGPGLLPLPHPSWRNNFWLKKNPWFETEILPMLRRRVRALL